MAERKTLDVVSKLLLMGGVVVGPYYILLAVFQMFIRPGFDPLRHDLSLMSNGPLGWIQIMNFIVSGLLVVGAAVGWRRMLKSGEGKTWGPILLGLFGLGLISAGIFVADPMNGFPPDMPQATTISSSAMLHLLSGLIGFSGFIATCFVIARRFKADKNRELANYSRATGIVFLLAFIGIAIGSQPGSPLLVPVTVAFTFAVVMAWTWISTISAKLIKGEI